VFIAIIINGFRLVFLEVMRDVSLSSVLVLDANQRSALSVTRSLGRAGISVVCGDVSESALAGASKYCLVYEQYSDPENTDLFINNINDLIALHEIKVLYPVAEITVYTLLENAERLDAVILPFSTIQTIKRLSDKGSLVKLCNTLGVNVPASDSFENALDLRAANKAYAYPVVLKPMLSRIKTSNGWIKTAVTYAHSERELLEIASCTVYFSDYPFMVQEYISGYGSGVFLLFSHGEYLTHFAHRRLREKPPSGGVSVLCESIEANASQLETSKRLLKSVAWHGVAMVEFKIDNQGKAYVIEVNPRFWGSLQLAIDSGVDFPYLLHQVSTGQEIDKVKQYDKGVQLRWFLGDLDRLYLVLKEMSLREFLKEAGRFLFAWKWRRKFEVERISDFCPSLFEIKTYIRQLLKLNSP
jgi:predicted ATP-grasp superfamily ATP-dependent carboligase